MLALPQPLRADVGVALERGEQVLEPMERDREAVLDGARRERDGEMRD